jgi:hypothetical protein
LRSILLAARVLRRARSLWSFFLSKDIVYCQREFVPQLVAQIQNRPEGQIRGFYVVVVAQLSMSGGGRVKSLISAIF